MSLGPEERFWLNLDLIAILLIWLYILTREMRMPDTQHQEREKRIHEMLEEHGAGSEYDVSTWTVDDIVADLLAFGELPDGWGDEEIKPHVISWKMKKGYTGHE